MSIDALPSLMKETYKFCRAYVKNKSVLDIGCGEGVVDLLISDIALNVIGIDVDKKVVERANSNFSGENLKFINMSGEKLSFADSTFDVVIAAQSIEHVQNDEFFVSEINRVLKKNGRFICTTPNKDSLVPPGEKVYDSPVYPFHVREYKPESFFSLLGKFFPSVEKLCFYNPYRDEKFFNNPRVRLLYKLSRFSFIRWLGRVLPLEVKQFLFYFKQANIKKEDRGTALCEMNDHLSFKPEVLCAVCTKN